MRKFHALSTGMALGLIGLVASFAGCSGSVQDSAGCGYNGKQYAVGDTFTDSDGCNRCSCGERGEVQCTLLGCDPAPDSGVYCTVDGKRYEVGQQVPSDACNTCLCSTSGPVSCTHRACPDAGSSCDSLVSELKATLSGVQKCMSAADCGQPIRGSSCGCTLDLVARSDADLSPYLAQKAKLQELGCTSEEGSVCNCPNADGFACINNVCGWNYVNVEPQPDPACQPYDVAELCVRGKATTDGELIAVGDELRVTVFSAGCLSSSCSKVVEASCSISLNTVFEVEANFCVANSARSGQACTDDCGTAQADCHTRVVSDADLGQSQLTAGDHQVKLGSLTVGFQVPSKLPLGGLCAGSR